VAYANIESLNFATYSNNKELQGLFIIKDWNFLPDETFDAFGFCWTGFATPSETFDTLLNGVFTCVLNLSKNDR